MCFGLRPSAKNNPSNGTDVNIPARKISSPQPIDGASEMSLKSAKPDEKPKKKKWNDDEYGDSVRYAFPHLQFTPISPAKTDNPRTWTWTAQLTGDPIVWH